MLIYRDAAGVPIRTAAFHAEVEATAAAMACGRVASYDAAVSLAIDLGMLESAVADIRQADQRQEPITMALRRASVHAARATLAARHGEVREIPRAADDVLEALRAYDRSELPATLRLRTPEGFAYYGLYPDMYADAARRVADHWPHGRFACVGIRSIGTTLSAFVTAALERAGCTARSWTVRPGGHPFDRRVAIGSSVAAFLLHPKPDLVLVADEGPGLSGSSFAATASALRSLGVSAERIVFLPAWVPGGSGFVSPRSREAWQAHRKVLVPFEEVWIDGGRLARLVGACSLEDVSAGRWRTHWPVAGEEPAVQTQHERRKYLARIGGATHPARLVKFAGLGRFGRDLADRALALRDTPAASEPRLTAGFLDMDIVQGTRLAPHDGTPEFLQVAARYLSEVAARFRQDAPADRPALAEMLELNARELLPDSPLPRLSRIMRHAASIPETAAVRLDARMRPHEWVRAAAGYVKTDALEHHDDHFFPGPQDIAWDVAATIEEFGLEVETADAFAERVAAASGDASLAARLEFHRAAYLAFRAAYCVMGAESLRGAPDAPRLAAAGARYRERLRTTLSG